MAIQSDANGFLVGEPIQDIKRVSKNTSLLLKEVKEIKKALGIKPNETQPRPVNPPAPPASNSGNSNNEQPQSRSQGNRASNSGTNNQSGGESANNQQPQSNSGSQAGNTGNAGNSASVNSQSGSNTGSGSQSVNPSASSENSESGTPPATRQRDARGRFLSNNDNTIDAGETSESNGRRRNARGQFEGGNGLDKDTKDGGNGLRGMFDSLGDRITTALDTQGLEEVDPTVKAFQETVEPLAKGYQFLFGSGNKQDKPMIGWLKRIFSTLKKTEKNTAEDSGGESGGGLMGLIAGAITTGLAALGLSSLTDDKGETLLDKGKNYIKDKTGYSDAVDWTSRNVVEPITPFIESIIQGWSAVFTNIGTSWDLFITSITAKWNIISTIVSETFKIFSTVFNGSWNKIVSVGVATFDYAGKSINSFLKEALSNIVGFISDLMTGLSGFLKDKFGIDISSTVSDIANKAAEMKQSASNAAIEAQNSKQILTTKTNDLTHPITEQIAASQQKINEVTERENKLIDEAAEKNNKAAEKTAEAVSNYIDKLTGLTKKIGGGAMDAVIGTADASETPVGGYDTKGSGVDAKGFGSISSVKEAGKGWNIVERPDGSIVKQEGQRNWRNNNPGNIEYGDFAKKHGAIAGDGRFAIFPDYKTGRAAKASLLFDGKNYRDKNLSDAIARYAPAFENNTAGYAGSVMKAVGSNKKMSEYSIAERNTIMDAMQKVEGGKVGKETIIRPATKNIKTQSADITQEQITAAAPKSPAVTASTIAVSNPAPVMPATPKAPKIAETTPTILPLISKDSRGTPAPIMVSEIGQDLPDRALAHIATGGISGI